MLGINLTAPLLFAHLVELFITSEAYIPTQFGDIFPFVMGMLCALLGLFISLKLKMDKNALLTMTLAFSLMGTISGFFRFKKIDYEEKKYNRTCKINVFDEYSPPTRNNRNKFIAAQRACEAKVCTSDNCCANVLQLNHNSTSKIHGSLFDRDCLLLLANKCDNDRDRIQYTNRVMQYLETLGDGSPCSSESCAKNQFTVDQIKTPMDIKTTNAKDITLNQDKIAFVKTLSDKTWSTVAGEVVTTVDDNGSITSETIFSGCEYCDTMDLFNIRGPVNQVRYWLKNLMKRVDSLAPVCSTCIETVGDLVHCIGNESPDNIFSTDPMLLADIKYALAFQSVDEKLDKRPECFTEHAPESCINIRLSKFEKFSSKCIRNGTSMCI